MARRRHRRVRAVEGALRVRAIDVLVALRAPMLGVPVESLREAIRLTDRDRLRTLVEVDGALACSLREAVQ